MSKDKIPDYLLKPFRVCHEGGSVVAGFDDRVSANENAAERNSRAEKLKLSARYTVVEKPQ